LNKLERKKREKRRRREKLGLACPSCLPCKQSAC
jgi:hypothetical protein